MKVYAFLKRMKSTILNLFRMGCLPKKQQVLAFISFFVGRCARHAFLLSLSQPWTGGVQICGMGRWRFWQEGGEDLMGRKLSWHMWPKKSWQKGCQKGSICLLVCLLACMYVCLLVCFGCLVWLFFLNLCVTKTILAKKCLWNRCYMVFFIDVYIIVKRKSKTLQ